MLLLFVVVFWPFMPEDKSYNTSAASNVISGTGMSNNWLALLGSHYSQFSVPVYGFV